MGGFLINVFVRSDDQEPVVTAVTETISVLRGEHIEGRGRPFAQGLQSLIDKLTDAGPLGDGAIAALGMGPLMGSMDLAFVAPAVNGWVGIYPDSGDPEELARILSERLKTTVLSFAIHDGDFLQYWIFENSELMDQYHSSPGYFGESVSAAERRRLRGKAEVLADLCNQATASQRLQRLLADPPSDAFALLDEIGELMQLPNVLLKYDYLADPSEQDQVVGRSHYRTITVDDVRAIKVQRAEPPVEQRATTSDRDMVLQVLEQLHAQMAREQRAEDRRRARLERARDPWFGADYPAIHPNVVGNLVTFANHNTPQGRRTLVEAFLAMRSVLEPLIPRGFNLAWEYIYQHRGSFSTKGFRSSKAKDVEMVEILMSEEIRSVKLAADMYGPWVLACEFTPLRPGWPTALAFSYDPKCTSQTGAVTVDWQARTVALVRDLAVRINAACGYLSLEDTNLSGSMVGTHYEYLVNAVGDDQFTRLNDTYRGYFWGNILGREHINRLGGLERVLETAPGKCVPFPDANGPWVYLQVSDDINEYGDDALRQLRSFLSPILPSGPLRTGLARHGRLLYD